MPTPGTSTSLPSQVRRPQELRYSRPLEQRDFLFWFLNIFSVVPDFRRLVYGGWLMDGQFLFFGELTATEVRNPPPIFSLKTALF